MTTGPYKRGKNKKSQAAAKNSKASNRIRIANKAVSTAKKSGSAQDKAIAKQAIKRKKGGHRPPVKL